MKNVYFISNINILYFCYIIVFIIRSCWNVACVWCYVAKTSGWSNRCFRKSLPNTRDSRTAGKCVSPWTRVRVCRTIAWAEFWPTVRTRCSWTTRWPLVSDFPPTFDYFRFCGSDFSTGTNECVNLYRRPRNINNILLLYYIIYYIVMNNIRKGHTTDITNRIVSFFFRFWDRFVFINNITENCLIKDWFKKK